MNPVIAAGFAACLNFVSPNSINYGGFGPIQHSSITVTNQYGESAGSETFLEPFNKECQEIKKQYDLELDRDYIKSEQEVAKEQRRKYEPAIKAAMKEIQNAVH